MSTAAYPYPSFQEIQAERLAKHRATAVAAARAAAAAVAPLGVRVLVFGSLVEGGFHLRSDIDLGLEGPEEAMFKAQSVAFNAAGDAGMIADVVAVPFASAGLVERIRSSGRDPAALE